MTRFSAPTARFRRWGILRTGGALTASVAERLKRSYVMLRNLEHAIQYVDDQQTQLWPTDPAARHRVAMLYGEEESALDAKLQEVREFVRTTFDSIFHAQEQTEESASDWPEGWTAGLPDTEKPLAAKSPPSGIRIRIHSRPGFSL